MSAAPFPAEATAPTCYGPNLAGFAQLTRSQLQTAPVAHFDETGARVAGRLRWVHVGCTNALTLYHQASGRGQASADLGGVLPDFTGVAVHDGLTSYRRYDVEHGLCNAHHLRELTGLTQTLGNEETGWPAKMTDLLVELNTTVNQAKADGNTCLAARTLADYQRRYRAIIAQGHQAHPPPPPTGKRGRPKLGVAGSLLRRLDLYQDDVLRFATNFTVPFDNNQAERDIRMIRLQQKISGCWRTEHGLNAFLSVRSYLSTTSKNRHNQLDALRALFTGHHWLSTPAPAT